MCPTILPACVSAHHEHEVPVAARKGGIGFPTTKMTDDCELPYER